MAAVDTAAKEMEALHVGQNDEMKVSSCISSFVFHAPWNESLMPFLQKGEYIFFGIYLRTGGVFLVSRVDPVLVMIAGRCSCIHMFNALFLFICSVLQLCSI
jgi:hypothetical protein